MSFWKSSDKIPIEQTSISIPSTNGLEYSSGGRILIEIPAGENGLEFFQPKETMLKFDVKISGTADECPKIQLDDVIGAQILLKNVRISSGGARNLLLEEIQDYNILTRVKYDYETNENLRNKRQMTEGVSCYSERNRGQGGALKSACNDTGKNNYFHPVTAQPAVRFGDVNYKVCKVCLPLNTGIFNNDKIFPIGLTEGLRIEIDIEDKSKVFRGLDTMSMRRTVRNNPVFHSIDGAVAGAGTGWAAAAGTQVIYVARQNGQTQFENLPFHKGQRIGLVKGDLTAGMVRENDFRNAANTVDRIAVIESIEADVTVLSGDGGAGLFKITLAGGDDTTNNSGGAIATLHAAGDDWGAKYYLFDMDAEFANPAPSFTISNVEMIVQQIGMPAGYTGKMRSMMKEGGVMNYDFLSFTNYKYSQQLSDRVMNMRLPLGNSRAKAIISVPVDSTLRTASQVMSGKPTTGGTGMYEIVNTIGDDSTHQLVSNSPGLTGCWDYLTNYQWYYDGKLNPSRPVDCAKISNKQSVEQQALIELEKGLIVSGIQPLSFRAFQSNCVISRALSTGDGVYDTRGKDFNLQANYNEGNVGFRPSTVNQAGAFQGQAADLATPQLPHLWCNFVSHIRRLSFKGNAISLET